MRPMRYMLQLVAFAFFAVYFLYLVSGRPFRLPELRTQTVAEAATPPMAPVKPSPIVMLRATLD